MAICPHQSGQFCWLKVGIGVAGHQGRHCVPSRNVCMHHCLHSVANFM
jgi:hypothetical protein